MKGLVCANYARLIFRGDRMKSILSCNWLGVSDGDPRAYALMRKHYSFQPYRDGRRQNLYNRNRHLFVGPGHKMVLMTLGCDALFVWRKFIDKSGQVGINCAVFRNEGSVLSSKLIIEAEELAILRWGNRRFYTYINARKIESPNPGYCFLKAGWNKCGITKIKKLLILEKLAAIE